MAKVKQGYHHGDLKRSLVEAAVELVEEGGVASLSLRRAAKRVGVTHAAPYRHFKDKAELLAAVAERGFIALAERMRRDSATAPNPVEHFRALGITYVKFATESPGYLRVMFGPDLGGRTKEFPALLNASQQAFDLLLTAVKSCQQAGLVRAGNPIEAAVTAWSTVHGLTALLIDGMLPQRDDIVDHYADIVTQALYDGLASYKPTE